MIPMLPPTYDILFLAGGYAEPPISRFNQNVVRCGRMKCTSTFGASLEFAKKFTEKMDRDSNGDLDFNLGAADDFLSSEAHSMTFYCLQPRLLYQRMSKSDLTGRTDSYLFSMTDPVHENMV